MEILPSNNILDNYKDLSVIQRKVDNLNKDDDEKLMEVCREFESIFLYMVLKEMKKTVPEDGLIEKSQASRIFEDMYFEELSKEMTRNNSSGIATCFMTNLKMEG